MLRVYARGQGAEEEALKEVQGDVKVMRTTAEIWTFLDQEYGSTLELTSTLVSALENFQFCKAARTESEKFLEQYRAWTSVHNDLLSDYDSLTFGLSLFHVGGPCAWCCM